MAKYRYTPAFTPEHLHKLRLLCEAAEPRREELPPPVDWKLNAQAISRMREE